MYHADNFVYILSIFDEKQVSTLLSKYIFRKETGFECSSLKTGNLISNHFYWNLFLASYLIGHAYKIVSDLKKVANVPDTFLLAMAFSSYQGFV